MNGLEEEIRQIMKCRNKTAHGCLRNQPAVPETVSESAEAVPGKSAGEEAYSDEGSGNDDWL